MKKLRNNKIRKLLAFMVALALMVSCMPSAYTISASEAFGDGTEDIFTDGEITSEPAAEESTPDVSSADQEETEQAQQSTLTYENDSVKVTAEALEDGALPQNTALKADGVNENSSVSYDTVSQKLSAAATDKGSSLRGFFAYDVYFADGDGNRVEPNGRVRVTFEYKTPAAPELTDAASTSVTVEKLHYNSSTGDTDVNTLQANEDLKVLNVNEGKQIQTLQVETGNAAVFAVMWDSPETADVKAEAVSGNEDEVPIASEELTDGMDISDEPEQDAAETPTAENPEVTPEAEPSEEPAVEPTEAPAENPDAEPTEAPAENPDVVEEPAEDIASPDEVPAADENGETSLIEVLGDDTNLRVSPSTEAEVLATVNAGTQLTLLDTVTAEDGATWYKVSWEGTEAYIRSDMAQVVDSSDEAEEVEDVLESEEVSYSKTIGDVVVTATAARGVIPEDAQFVVNPIEKGSDQYTDVADRLEKKAENEEYSIAGFLAYDIYFQDSEGNKINPEEGKVKVSMEYQNATVPDEVKEADVATMAMASADESSQDDTEAAEQNLSVSVMHFVEDANGNVESVVDMTKDDTANVETNAEGEVQKAEFETESFSTFTITWTRNGYKYSLNIKLIDINGNDVGTTNSAYGPLKEDKKYEIKDSNAPTIENYSFYGAKVATNPQDTGTTIKYLRYKYGHHQYSTDSDNWNRIEQGQSVYFVYAKNLETVETVDHTSAGIVMRMKDLEGDSKKIGPDKNSYIDIGGGYGNGNIKQGLLQNVLAANGYPVVSGSSNTNLESLFNGGMVNNLFLKTTYDQTGYYEYSSFNNYAYLGQNSKFTVYNAIGTPTDEAQYFYQRGNFMPYNNISNGKFSTNRNLYDEDGVPLDDSNSAKGKALYKTQGTNNYQFSMDMEANFIQPKDGKVTPPNSSSKEDMIYEFNGDDDMWIYIDNVLVLDIGGVHDAHSGKINFNTGVVSWKDCVKGGTPKETTTTIRAIFQALRRFPDGTKWDDSKVSDYFNGNTFKDYTMHSFKMFYMERGGGASNLHMKFNIQVIPNGQVEVKKELGNTDKEKYSDVKFAFQLYAQEITDHDSKGNEIYSDKYVLLGQDSAVYGNLGQPTSEKIQFGTKRINGTDYKNVFELRPDESAIFTNLQANRQYYVKEIGVESSKYDVVKINGTITTDENGKGISSAEATVERRPVIVFTNDCSAANLRELSIVKNIKGNLETDDTFSFKVQLNNQDGELVDYTGDYYLQDAQGNYYKLVDGQLVKQEGEKTVCGSAVNGSISQVPVGYKVSITNILSGTRFCVTEENMPNNKYSTPQYKTGLLDSTGNKIPNTEEDTNTGTIELSKNSQVTVTNVPYYTINVEKKWNNGNEEISGSESVYVGLFKEDGTPVPGTEEKHNYLQLTSENNYEGNFEKLDSTDYVVKELKEVNVNDDGVSRYIQIGGKYYGAVDEDTFTEIANKSYRVSYQEIISESRVEKTVIVTNKQSGKITVIKNWTDGNENHANDTVTAGLFKGETLEKIFELNTGNEWRTDISVDGSTSNYTVAELQEDENGTIVNPNNNNKKYTKVNDGAIVKFSDHNYQVNVAEEKEIKSESEKEVTITNKRLGSISIRKVDSQNKNATLAGAKFKLKKDNDYVKDSNGTEIEVTTDGDGGAIFEKLEPGTYILEETKAPKGYSLPATGIEIKVGIDNNDYEIDKTVQNAKLYSLPNSGGPGTYGFTISGVAILATALLLFINNKRREEEAKRS